jgi:hypothetical protein
MNPAPKSPNLGLFKENIRKHSRYRLFPAHATKGQIRDMDLELYVEKRIIHLLNSDSIKPDNPEQAVFA